MTNHNQPTRPEIQAPTFEIVQYLDDHTSMVFDKPGEILDLSMASLQKHLRHLGKSNHFGIIRTHSGNAYGVGEGIVINKNTHAVYSIPDELEPITIGAPYRIPGVGSMTEIDSVEVEYRYLETGSADTQINRPSPFHALRADIEVARLSMSSEA